MSQITQLASRLFTSTGFSPVKTLATEKRIRGVLNGHVIFDTTSALLVWEHAYFPQYWIPKSDFVHDTAVFEKDQPISGIESSTFSLTTTTTTTSASASALSSSSPSSGDGGSESDKTKKASVAALVVPEAFNHELAGLVKVEFKSIDAWYEELVPVLYHPKDPYHRVDLLSSGRRVRVELEDGTLLADTGTEGGVVSLWETRFPGRWYLPATAIQWQHLKKSETKTGCPYKGEASYYSAVVGGKETKDVVWYYENPTLESAGIRGMYCFYPDKVRTWVDGKEIERVGMPKKSLEAIKASEGASATNGGKEGHSKSCDC